MNPVTEVITCPKSSLIEMLQWLRFCGLRADSYFLWTVTY
jgi:hypothetical protein